MKMKGLTLIISILVLCGSMTMAAHAADKVIIGTFGDPVPVQMAAHDGILAAATGWNIDWRKFASGTDVIAAMASGDVLLAELGSSPFAIGATQGVDFEAFMLDYVIGKSESLIVRNGAGINSLTDLKGKRGGNTNRLDGAFLTDGSLEACRYRRQRLDDHGYAAGSDHCGLATGRYRCRLRLAAGADSNPEDWQTVSRRR